MTAETLAILHPRAANATNSCRIARRSSAATGSVGSTAASSAHGIGELPSAGTPEPAGPKISAPGEPDDHQRWAWFREQFRKAVVLQECRVMGASSAAAEGEGHTYLVGDRATEACEALR